MTFNDNVRRLKSGLAAVGVTGLQSANLGAIVGGSPLIFTDNTRQYVYVRINGSTDYTIVRYADVPLEYDLEIKVGFAYGAIEMQIIEVDYERRVVNGKGNVMAGVTSHAPQHSFPVTPGQPVTGNKVRDPVFVWGHQVSTLNITPSSGMVVKIMPGPLEFTDGWRWWYGQESSDLTASIPAAADEGAIVLVEIDNALAITYTVGTAFAMPVTADAMMQNAPAPTSGRIAMGMLLLVNGMTAINWQHIIPMGWRTPRPTAQGVLPIANGGTGQTTQTAAFDALSPLTTKGDVIAYDSTDNVRLAVGSADGMLLSVDSSTATGLAWTGVGATYEATLATSDNTVTTVFSYVVAELVTVTIHGHYTASKTDKSAAAGGSFRASYRRATGGNCTLVGTGWIEQEDDSGGTPVISVDADTGTQSARIRWQGITAEDWTVKIQYEVIAY